MWGVPVASDSEAVLRRLRALVTKQGVGLGVMRADERELALAVAAWALPATRDCTEAEVNAVLREVLGEEGRFLDTDHVELRRWLVDTGWWRRDGYGRAYTRTPDAELPPGLLAVTRSLQEGLQGQSLRAWIAACHDAVAAQREARRAAWAARAGATQESAGD